MAEKQKVLVTYTFSKADQKVLEFVTKTFCDRDGVRITLFSCYLPLPETSPDFSKSLGSWPAVIGEAMLRNGIARQLQEYENRLKETKHHLVKQGFPEDSVDYVFRQSTKDEADEIIRTAHDGGYEVIVLSFRPSKIRHIFAKNIYQTIMAALKDVAICVIT